MVDRKLLRRVAAILFHRRAGFSANGMGVWKVPEDRIIELGPRMAAVRGISHCYQRPTYPDWPYSVFTMAHGRSKEECDAVLDGVADVHGLDGDDRSTLYSSTEFKKIRLHYFTARLRGVGSRESYAASRRHARVGGALRACRRADAGRREQPGAGDALGRPRSALHRARRGRRAGRRRRQPLRRLRLLLGAADPRPRHPEVVEAVLLRRAGHELRRADGGGGRARRRGCRARAGRRDGAARQLAGPRRR